MQFGSILGDKYRLEEVLGRGGMGSVWRAEHLGFKAPVAIKLMDRAVAMDPDALARFHREAHAAASIRSPHVVQVLDHGVDEPSNTPFIVMELLDGETLAERLIRAGPLSPEQTASVIDDVCCALARVHAAGIVHRDVKPANVFLVKDEREFAKVLDFGVAKAPPYALDASDTTRTGLLIGTPYYMSPEQISGSKQLDGRSDLWSVAVMTCECLTGRRPFDGSVIGALAVAICSQPIPRATTLGNVGPAFEAWLDRALQRDPAARFQTARELAEALRSACVGPHAEVDARPGAIDDGTSAAARSIAVASPAFAPRRRRQVALLLAAGMFSSSVAWLALRGRAERPEASSTAESTSKSVTTARLTKTGETSVRPSFLSPSGKQLTFVDHRGLMLLDLTTGARRRLLPPETGVYQAQWLPGNQELVVQLDAQGLPAKLERLDLTTLQRVPLAAAVKSRSVISPDGRLWAANADEVTVEIAPLAGDGPTRSLRAPGAAPGGPLSWSPDARWIAVFDAIGRAIRALNVESGELKTLVQRDGLHSKVGLPAFAWHGNWQLSYQLVDGDVGALWASNIDPRTLEPSPPRRLSHEPFHATWMDGNATGDRLVIHQLRTRESVLGARQRGPGRLEAPLAAVSRRDVDEYVAGSQPGQLVVQTTLDGLQRLALTALDDGSLTPWLAVGDHTRPTLALGIRGFLFYRSGAQGTRLWRQPEALGSVPLPVGPVPDADTDWFEDHCAARAERCFRVRNRDGDWRISDLSVTNGSEHGEITIPGAFGVGNISVAADARAWAVGRASAHDPSVRFYDHHGQLTATHRLPEECFAQHVAFSPDGSGVYASGMCPAQTEPYHLLFVARDGEVQSVGTSKEDWLYRPAVSPDGSWLFVNSRSFDEEIWVLDAPQTIPSKS